MIDSSKGKLIGLGFILLIALIFLVVMNNNRMDSSSKGGKINEIAEMAAREAAPVQSKAVMHAETHTVLRHFDNMPLAVTSYAVNFQWTITDMVTTSIRLKRGVQSGVYTVLRDIGLVTSITDSGLDPAQTYFYVVTGFNGPFEGPPSNEVVVLPVAPTPAPTATATATATAMATVVPSPTATATATPASGFTISVYPISRTVLPTATWNTAIYQVTIKKTPGFVSTVGLTVQGLPPGVEIVTQQNPSNTVRNIMLNVLYFVPPGTYPFTITAHGGNPLLTRTAQATLIR